MPAACHVTIRRKIAKIVCREARIVPNLNVKLVPACSIWGMSAYRSLKTALRAEIDEDA
jgi:hypothetical protein